MSWSVPPERSADPEARLVAQGFSSRSQVHGLAGVHALHPVEVLAEAVCAPAFGKKNH